MDNDLMSNKADIEVDSVQVQDNDTAEAIDVVKDAVTDEASEAIAAEEPIPIEISDKVVTPAPKPKIIRAFTVILALELLAVASCIVYNSQCKKMQTALEMAQENINDDNYPMAKEQLGRITKIYPQYKEAQYDLSFMDEMDKVKEALEKSATLVNTKDYDSAMQQTDEALATIKAMDSKAIENPLMEDFFTLKKVAYCNVYEKKAEVEFANGDTDSGLNNIDIALFYMPDSEASLALQEYIENCKAALEYLQVAIKCFRQDNDVQGALDNIELSLQHFPDYEPALILKQEVETYKTASEYLDKAQKCFNTDDDIDGALSNVELALQSKPDYEAALTLKQDIQNYQQAIQLINNAFAACDSFSYDTALNYMNQAFALSDKAANEYATNKANLESIKAEYDMIMKEPIKIIDVQAEWRGKSEIFVTVRAGNYSPYTAYNVTEKVSITYKNKVIGTATKNIGSIQSNYYVDYIIDCKVPFPVSDTYDAALSYFGMLADRAASGQAMPLDNINVEITNYNF
jgi:tetratricopeptide (TPR) repeat protein